MPPTNFRIPNTGDDDLSRRENFYDTCKYCKFYKEDNSINEGVCKLFNYCVQDWTYKSTSPSYIRVSDNYYTPVNNSVRVDLRDWGVCDCYLYDWYHGSKYFSRKKIWCAIAMSSSLLVEVNGTFGSIIFMILSIFALFFVEKVAFIRNKKKIMQNLEERKNKISLDWSEEGF